MPELPDFSLYREALAVRVCGQTLDRGSLDELA